MMHFNSLQDLIEFAITDEWLLSHSEYSGTVHLDKDNLDIPFYLEYSCKVEDYYAIINHILYDNVDFVVSNYFPNNNIKLKSAEAISLNIIMPNCGELVPTITIPSRHQETLINSIQEL